MTERPPLPRRLVVDAEIFELSEDPDQPGGCHYTWLTGPHPGYGFTSVPSDGHTLTVDEHEAAIREFLGAVDPATGYLD